MTALCGGVRFVRVAAVAVPLVVVLGACGSAPKQPGSASEDAPPATRGGGYYLDDGPGATPPANLDRIPDAQPRAETLHRAANRPYSVFGREYVPMRALAPYRERGVASWYGRRYHGQRTSTGETYDMYQMTAAHPTLPLPSYARVTSLANGRSVVVRVNDRGPFLGGRIVDLSYAAAYRLGYINQGSAPVEVELIVPGQSPTATVATPATVAPAPGARASVERAPAASSVAPASTRAPIASAPSVASIATATTAPPAAPIAEAANGVFVQLGAFSAAENAELFRARLASRAAWLGDALRIDSREGLHRIQAGPYGDRIEALAVAQRIRESLEVVPVIVAK
ncbi:MAG: septal ring lytic transglycosylase RlpA family protein [Burkholderiales bacterium]|nr:septal ring lytic transglycosylase RlpA family protein [Burkholderiales bacterium]